MSAPTEKAKALEKKRKKILEDMFGKQPDDLNIFDPQENGEFILGKLADYGTSKEYETPYLVLLDKDGLETTVFMKMGIVPKMRRKKWITIEDKWNKPVVDEEIGNLICFQYVEEATSDRTGRKFQKYKILFPDDLSNEGITSL